uniref:RNA helicase n=1 Tax=Plectus sambesii TaxID=2011161 RepID=A0A914UWD0_9BILA
MICNNCKRSGHSAIDCPLKSAGNQNRGGRQDGEHPARFGGAAKYEPLTPSTDELFDRAIDVGQNYDNLLDLPVQRSDTTAASTSIGDIKPIQLFAEAKLDERVYINVKHSGYEAPTPIQRYAIPLVLAERDIMACAQTGSGKTAAYLVPMVSMLLTDCPPASGPHGGDAPCPLALIFAPTRELVKQIWWETLKFADGTRIKSMATYGGTNLQSEVEQLQNGPEIVVATPGRLIHLVREGH